MIRVTPLRTSEPAVRSSLPSALYVASNKNYQIAYNQDWTYEDLSVGLYDSASAALLAYICMTVGRNDSGQRELSYYGLPAVCVVPEKENPAVCHALGKVVMDILQQYAPCTLKYKEDASPAGLSPVAQRLLQAGAACELSFKSVLDLTRGELWADVRKSYRSLIHKGQKLLTHTIVSAGEADTVFFDQFKALHIHVSGRQTRNDVSWQQQLEAVRQGEAFAVASSLNGTLCGVSYHITNKVSCYYGVGAYERSLFLTHPVSHAALWTAIEHAKNMGCVRFELGETFFPFQTATVSEKQQNIGIFKRGFGGAVFSVLTLRGHIHVA